MSEDVTQNYGKEVNAELSLTFLDLEHTGSWDDRENQIVELILPNEMVSAVRTAYRNRNPPRINDFETVRNDDGTTSIYCGSSYGASELLGAVGELIYYGELFHEH